MELVFDLVKHVHRQRAFSEKTFGPGARAKGVLDHIRKELNEIEEEPSDLTEWVDVILLALDGAWRAGWLPEQIAQAIENKQTKNEGRTWPDWRTASPDKAIEHVRDEYALPVLAEEKRTTDSERITEEYAQAVRKLERELAEVKAGRDGLALCLRDEADIATSAQLQSRLDSALAALRDALWVCETADFFPDLQGRLNAALSGHAVPVAAPSGGDCSMCAKARERMAGRAAAPWTCPQCGRASMPESAPPRPPPFAVFTEHPALGVKDCKHDGGRRIKFHVLENFDKLVSNCISIEEYATSRADEDVMCCQCGAILSAHGKEGA